jgi:hypothetical protein
MITIRNNRYSKVAAERIALIGASRMPGEGYKLERSRMNKSVWKVTRPESKGGGFYRVQLANERGGMKENCTCPFFRENGTCKHVLQVRAEAEAVEFCAALATA